MGPLGDIGRIVGLGVGGLGTVFLLAGALWLRSSRRFKKQATETTGTVTGFVEHRSTDGSGPSATRITFAPSVRFTASNGKEVEFVSRISRRRPKYAMGASVPVLYLEHKPRKAKLKGGASLYLGALSILFTGLVLCVVGGGLYLYLGTL